MKNLSELAGETIFIHQPSVWKNYYELKFGEDVLGTIRSKGFFGTNMFFKFGNDEWQIYRPSFWKSEIAIRESGFQLPYATYKRDTLKLRGTLYLPRGARLKFIFKVFRGGYEIQDESENTLVRCKDKASLRTKTDIVIERDSELINKYPWAIILIWYISYKRRQAAHAG
jgi:hypothetical protein